MGTQLLWNGNRTRTRYALLNGAVFSEVSISNYAKLPHFLSRSALNK